MKCSRHLYAIPVSRFSALAKPRRHLRRYISTREGKSFYRRFNFETLLSGDVIYYAEIDNVVTNLLNNLFRGCWIDKAFDYTIDVIKFIAHIKFLFYTYCLMIHNVNFGAGDYYTYVFRANLEHEITSTQNTDLRHHGDFCRFLPSLSGRAVELLLLI